MATVGLAGGLARAAATHTASAPLRLAELLLLDDDPAGLNPKLPDGLTVPEVIGGAAAAVVFVSVLTLLLGRCLMRRNTPLGKIMRLAGAEVQLLIPATFCLFASAGFQMLIPYYGGRFIQMLNHPGGIHSDQLTRLMVAILVTAVLISITTCIRGTLYNLAGERVICKLRKRVFEALLAQEIAYFDEQTSGALVSRLTSDTTALQTAASSYISMGIRSMANLIISMMILLVISWKLTLTMLGVVPAVSILAAFTSRLSRQASQKYQDQVAEAGKVASETFGNMRTVRVFRQGETLMARRYGGAADATYAWGKRTSFIYGAWSGFVGFFFFVAFTLVLWVGATLVQNEEIEAGALVSFILYTLSLSAAIMMLGSMLPQLGTTLGATVKIFAVLDRVPEMVDGTLHPGDSCRGLVEFDSVTFAYPSRSTANVLNEVSFSAQPNQVVALVGPSGSGKSSCVSLILRLYDVTGGSVRIDGQDVRQLRRDYLRQHIAVVSQEPILFAGSARENILFGSEEASDEQVVAAAKLANCHDFISAFPERYETLVGERGIQLSGGQKQRVAIARALLADPTVLLLDEATSALDSESERVVQQALNSLIERRKDRTSIVVAHRLSTIRGADLIVVLMGGQVVESGTHEQLVAKAGVYRDLVQRQLEDPSAGSDSADSPRLS